MKCENCRYFEADPSMKEENTGSSLGHCHRRAPQVFVAMAEAQPQQDIRAKMDGNKPRLVGGGVVALITRNMPGSAFPIVRPTQWCGEWAEISLS